MSFLNKIDSLENIGTKIEEIRRNKRKIVHCHGTFDLLHPGHLRYFQEAKSLGDVLIVTITADQYVNKGPNRPIFNQDLRAEAIASLEYVDHVAINHHCDAINLLKLLRPNLYVKGPDYVDHSLDKTGKISHEVDAVRSCGGDIHYTSGIQFSSTELINNYILELKS